MSRPIELLFVEDNDADVELTRRVFNGDGASGFHHVPDGTVALEFLRKQGRYSNAPSIDLVLMDINLPGKSGLDVLHEIRADERLRSLSVIIITGSCDDEDVAEAYGLNANCFIKKPKDAEQFQEAMRSFHDFWFRFVRLPGIG